MTKSLTIAFTGSHGTGKSTITEAVKKHIDAMNLYRVVTYTIPTVARKCPFPINGSNQKTTVCAQNWIIQNRCLREDEILNPLLDPFKENIVLISARTVLDDFAYLISRFPNDSSVKMEEAIVDYRMKKYDFIFYCGIDFPLEDDGKRDTDPEFQKEIDRIIIAELSKRDVSYVRLTGSVEDRVRQVMEIIESYIKKLEQDRLDDKNRTIDTLANMSIVTEK